MFSRVVTDQLIEAYANDDMDQQTVSMAKVKSQCLSLITDVLLVTKTPKRVKNVLKNFRATSLSTKMSENEMEDRKFLTENDVI